MEQIEKLFFGGGSVGDGRGRLGTVGVKFELFGVGFRVVVHLGLVYRMQKL